MTKREFTRRILNGQGDVLQDFLNHLKKLKIDFCVIGGLAVNAYAEPVVSLDLDIVVVAARIKDLISGFPASYKVRPFPNSLNIAIAGSDLRVQIQLDGRYQDFIGRARGKTVLGYRMPVAAPEDVLQGKIWAALDETRRPSKRQKDLADILRLVEAKAELAGRLPGSLRKRLGLA